LYQNLASVEAHWLGRKWSQCVTDKERAEAYQWWMSALAAQSGRLNAERPMTDKIWHNTFSVVEMTAFGYRANRTFVDICASASFGRIMRL
jgi:hypothetical protein